MYLDGNSLKAAAEAQHMSLAELQQRSGLPAEQVQYYWDDPAPVTSQEDIVVLARILQVEPDALLVQKEPEKVVFRSDKFTWYDDDIVFLNEDEEEGDEDEETR